MDGTVAINLYELTPIEQQQPEAMYITRQEFEFTINQLKEMLKPMPVDAPKEKPSFEF